VLKTTTAIPAIFLLCGDSTRSFTGTFFSWAQVKKACSGRDPELANGSNCRAYRQFP